jgi:hypothetical protein
VKGLREIMGKTKVMCCSVGYRQLEKSGKWPCGVYGKGVEANSIACTVCKQWVHRRCHGLSGSLKCCRWFYVQQMC